MKYKATIYVKMSTENMLEDVYPYFGYFETDLTKNELEDKLVEIATIFHRSWKHIDAFHVFNEAVRLGYIKDAEIEEGDGHIPNYNKKYKVEIDPIPDPIMEWC